MINNESFTVRSFAQAMPHSKDPDTRDLHTSIFNILSSISRLLSLLVSTKGSKTYVQLLESNQKMLSNLLENHHTETTFMYLLMKKKILAIELQKCASEAQKEPELMEAFYVRCRNVDAVLKSEPSTNVNVYTIDKVRHILGWATYWNLETVCGWELPLSGGEGRGKDNDKNRIESFSTRYGRAIDKLKEREYYVDESLLKDAVCLKF
ncbi:hypothetical protein FPQ18DRAFT_395735 [Pyronema domesticum]|nr:hypothetical protein FPQ18DRAFT_395735 [Pyronema domesticum]